MKKMKKRSLSGVEGGDCNGLQEIDTEQNRFNKAQNG